VDRSPGCVQARRGVGHQAVECKGDAGLSRIRECRAGLTGQLAVVRLAVVMLAGALTSSCGGMVQTYQHGYMVAEGSLEQIPLGASQEQVLIVLGTPSTVATISGEVFYYISQRSQQISFLPQKEIDRRVVAVYFDKGRRVQRLADYGLKDGRIFDFIGRTTPSGGVEQNYLAFVFKISKF
jgi:outer membrane protein assembly factor BamE (lipoprotein component of BamABCDE complex)